MQKEDKIIYRATVSNEGDNEDGVNFISLVEDPAIEMNWMAFNKDQKSKQKFSIYSSERRILCGVVMLADVPIIKYDKENDEYYYVVFTKKDLEEIVKKYHRDQKNKQVNIEHREEDVVKDVYMYQSYLTDHQNGVYAPSYLRDKENITDGSWIAYFKIDNEFVWDHLIRTGELKGFSLEGYFKLEKEKNNERDSRFEEEEYSKEIEEINKKLKKILNT